MGLMKRDSGPSDIVGIENPILEERNFTESQEFMGCSPSRIHRIPGLGMDNESNAGFSQRDPNELSSSLVQNN